MDADTARDLQKEKEQFEKQEAALKARGDKIRAATSKPGNKYGITSEVVDLYSDGTRLSGTVWRPDGGASSSSSAGATGAKGAAGTGEPLLPAILLCHGWGGKRAHLDFSYAKAFAQAGFIALTFDYRTWGDSDGILLSEGPQPRPDPSTGLVTVQARLVRKIVDPEWQLRDVNSALNYLESVPGVDATRIGIWGSSLGGGHVLSTAGRDDRIRCVVCQIGSIDTHANWINRHPQYKGRQAIAGLRSAQARGEAFPWTLTNPKGLDGAPNLPKVVFEHRPVAYVDNIRVPTLILAAENEELFKNEKNSELVYDKLSRRGGALAPPCELGYLPGGHYDAYGQPAFGIGCKRAVEWFSLYIGDGPAAKL